MELFHLISDSDTAQAIFNINNRWT